MAIVALGHEKVWASLGAAVELTGWTWKYKALAAVVLGGLALMVLVQGGRTMRLMRLRRMASTQNHVGNADAPGMAWESMLELTQGLKQMLLELQALVTEEGAMTRQCMPFEDVQARIQAVMNKAVANSGALEKIAQRLETVHSGLAKTAATFHKEGMDTIEDYLQTLKKDLQEFFTKTGTAHNEDLIKKLDVFMKKALEKLKSDMEASLVTCTTTLQGDFNTLKKSQGMFGAAMSDKFQEVLKEMAKNYDNAMKVCKETRDLVRWQQSQLETLQGRTDHLPDRLGILRDTLNDTQQLVLDVKGYMEDLRVQMEEDKTCQDRTEQTSPPHGTWTAPPQGPQVGPTPGGPTMLNLDEQLPMPVGRPVLTPLTLQDGRVICIPRAMLSQLLGGAL